MSARTPAPTDPDAFVLVKANTASSPSMASQHPPSSLLDKALVWFRSDRADTDSTAWPQDAIHLVRSRRASLPGAKLFLDELFSLAHVDASLYPPASYHSLVRLLDAIYSSPTFDSLKQSSLVYYLLKDFDAFTIAHVNDDARMLQDTVAPTTPKADAFAASSLILPHFKDLMDAYWLLDRGQYQDAIPLLSSPDFIPKIYRTLFQQQAAKDAKHNLQQQQQQQPQRSPLDRSRLLLRFLRTSTQPSSSPRDSAEYFEELEMQVQAVCCVRGPTKAFGLVREIAARFDDEGTGDVRRAIRARLLPSIFHHCFAPPNPVAIKNLRGCFLDADEQLALETFVLTPPASMTATWSYIAADVLIVRFVDEGRYMDAVRLDRRLGPDVREGHSSSADHAERSRLMEKRKRLIAGAREILPEVQKELLRIEESMEISAGRRATADGKDDTGAKHHHHHQQEASGDLKMSWEEVPRPSNGNHTPRPHSSPIGTASKLTPLSASPALRHADNRSPSTQAALLSAVVRASAASPTRAGGQDGDSSHDASRAGQRAPQFGFLASHSLAFGQQGSPSCANGTTGSVIGGDVKDMDEDVQGAGATVDSQPFTATSSSTLLSKPGYRLATNIRDNASTAELGEAPSPTGGAAAAITPQSPWRNVAPLSSTSPFSGQPKVPSSSFLSRFDASHSGRSSSSASPFRPANTSPFVAASASAASSHRSPLTSSLRSGSPSVHLTGTLALISKQQGGRRRQETMQYVGVYDDDDDEDEGMEEDEDYNMHADDTFVGRPSRSLRGGNAKGKTQVQVGRLMHGTSGNLTTARDDDDDEDDGDEMDAPAAIGRHRRTAASKSKGTKSDNISQSHSEAMPKRTGRQTRSKTSMNRKPLTLSNLAANDESHSLPAGPIARRTRAATAELESQQGDDQVSQTHDADSMASTIYSISEHGDAEERDGLGKLPPSTSDSTTRRRGKRTSTTTGTDGGKTKQENSVRRSSRLSSIEPQDAATTRGQGENQENEPPKRKKATRASTAGSRNTTAGGEREGEAAQTATTGVKTRSGRRTMPGALGDE